MSLSTLVISDLDRFVGIKDFWDRELMDHVDDPFLTSSMLIEHWKFCQRIGEHPFLIVFLVGNRIVGFAPLRMRSRFGFRQVFSFDQYTPPIIFFDNYREVCVNTMINFLFKQLNCESADITFADDSVNQRIIEKACKKWDLNCTQFPEEGQAIIHVKTGLDSFQESIDKKALREFRRVGRKLDRLGSWQIYCSTLDRSSIEKIWAVEKYSWKVDLHGKEKAIKDMGLDFCLKGALRNGESEPSFDSEVWFLDLNDVPIAYVLVLKRNKTVFFAKTSYDSRFKDVYPGKFLMNDLIERIFKNNDAEIIDFISNLPFVHVWKPLVNKRITFRVLRNTFLSKAHFLVFENRISNKSLQIIERLQWEKRPS